MTRIAQLAGWIAGTAVAVLVLTPGPAAATRPIPDGPFQNPTVMVPVTVPADDTTDEAVQMAMAGALGAAAATAFRSRRVRHRDADSTDGFIDLTDTVRRGRGRQSPDPTRGSGRKSGGRPTS